jgi:DNA end-binding protein Ku
VTEGSDEGLDIGETVKGFEVSRGRHVVLTDAELKAAMPEQHRRIEIEQFVDIAEIDPLLWRKAYYVGAAQGGKADKPYLLLRRAMESAELAAIARLVMRSREYLVTIRPLEKAMVLHTMYFADEVLDAGDVRHLPSEQRLPPKELDLASKLIQSLTGPFEHDKYKDEYQRRVMALVKKKAQGKDIEVEPSEVAEGAKVIDLMAALKQSLDVPRSRAKGAPRKSDARRRRKAS